MVKAASGLSEFHKATFFFFCCCSIILFVRLCCPDARISSIQSEIQVFPPFAFPHNFFLYSYILYFLTVRHCSVCFPPFHIACPCSRIPRQGSKSRKKTGLTGFWRMIRKTFIIYCHYFAMESLSLAAGLFFTFLLFAFCLYYFVIFV